MADDKYCPVCRTQLKHDVDYMDYILCEEHWSCPECPFIDSFAYGDYHVCVGGQDFYWHYATDPSEIEAIEQRIIEAIALKRVHYLYTQLD